MKQSSEQNWTMDKLLEMSELLEMLGYSEERSVRTWCKKHKVPLFGVGKKTYTLANFFELFFTLELKKFLQANYPNPDEILEAIKADDKVSLVHSLAAPTENSVERSYKKKIARSKASEDLLSKLKSA